MHKSRLCVIIVILWFYLAKNFSSLLISYDVLASILYSLHFSSIAVTRTHIYFGGACFLVGGFVGLTIGLRLRSTLVVPQRMRAVVANSYRGIEVSRNF